MAFTLSRIDRVYRHYDVTATLANGQPATLTGVDVALLAARSKPTTATQWTPAAYASGTATVLLAGPDANASGALTFTGGEADLWLRFTDSPEVIAKLAERIAVS